MKKYLKISLFALLTMFFIQGFAQKKIAIDDQTNLLSSQIDLLLAEKFKVVGLDYDNMVDYKDRCNYHYTEILPDKGDRWVIILDCDNNKLGEKKLSSGIGQMTDNDKAGMLVFVIMDIIENPSDHRIASKSNDKKKKETAEEIIPEPSGDNEHTSRYFFSPSSYNLKKGELYYNTIFFAIHDAQYGVTDNFSVGMGTTLGAFPFYLTPKYSFKLGEKHRAAVGDMFILGTYGVDFAVNLLYGTYTYGDQHNNITLGGGWVYSPENDLFDNTVSKPIVNLSGMAQLSNYIYFISENYVFATNTTFTADSSYYNPNPPYDYIVTEEDYTLPDTYMVGFLGFRFINKRDDVKAWQAGLAYYNRFLGASPAKYDSPNWNNYDYPNFKRLFIPQISYTYKFGKKY